MATQNKSVSTQQTFDMIRLLRRRRVAPADISKAVRDDHERTLGRVLKKPTRLNGFRLSLAEVRPSAPAQGTRLAWLRRRETAIAAGITAGIVVTLSTLLSGTVHPSYVQAAFVTLGIRILLLNTVLVLIYIFRSQIGRALKP